MKTYHITPSEYQAVVDAAIAEARRPAAGGEAAQPPAQPDPPEWIDGVPVTSLHDAEVALIALLTVALVAACGWAGAVVGGW